MPLPPSITERLESELRCVDAINGAYLHGSLAKGSGRPESDVDVAILAFPGARLSARNALDLAGKLALIAGRDVDVAVLTTGNLVLAREVAEHRVVLFEKNEGAAAMFFATALGEYLDLKRARKPVERAYETG